MPVETDIMIEMAPNTHTRNLEENLILKDLQVVEVIRTDLFNGTIL